MSGQPQSQACTPRPEPVYIAASSSAIVPQPPERPPAEPGSRYVEQPVKRPGGNFRGKLPSPTLTCANTNGPCSVPPAFPRPHRARGNEVGNHAATMTTMTTTAHQTPGKTTRGNFLNFSPGGALTCANTIPRARPGRPGELAHGRQLVRALRTVAAMHPSRSRTPDADGGRGQPPRRPSEDNRGASAPVVDTPGQPRPMGPARRPQPEQRRLTKENR